MTSEIALLNKHAIALAADSATTVTYWERGERRRRYLKGANKIFNISKLHPVGLMTYDSANLQGVPWEVLAKGYRSHLGSRSHDHLPGYATDFFEDISNDVHIFPQRLMERQFLSQVDRSAAIIIMPIVSSDLYKNEPDPAKRGTFFSVGLQSRKTEVENAPFITGASQADVDSADARYFADTKKMIDEDSFYQTRVPATAVDDLAHTAVGAVYKDGFSGLENTGLVFAGYGDNDFFPRLEAYSVRGLLLGTVFQARVNEVNIDQESASNFVPFAQAEMINTFIWGISTEAHMEIENLMMKQLDLIEKNLKSAGHMPSSTNCDQEKSEARARFRTDIIDYLNQSHQVPLRRVIANLPISELAELAETLVSLESLKQRVRSPEESVSGPIDVAVISKGDGFIWIKRKHYFGTKYNPRFFSRLDLSMED